MAKATLAAAKTEANNFYESPTESGIPINSFDGAHLGLG